MMERIQRGGITRRRLLGAASAAALVGAGGGRAAAMQTGATPASDGAWTLTDDAGQTVTLPARPRRVVADLNAASALWDFGIRPIAVCGWTTDTDAAWGNVDRTTPVITASLESGEPSLEKLLALQADLFVTICWGDSDNAYEWSFPEPAAYERAREVVPIVGISGTGMADANMKRFAELAGLLGADLESAELQAAKAAYEAAAAAFETTARGKADLTTLFVYADGEYEYVAYPPIWADLAMCQRLGLNIIEPEVKPNEYWQELSPEQARLYQSDVLFQSTRAGVFTLDQLKAHPTYGQLPAVKAGQMASWNQDFIQSYQGLTAALTAITAALEPARDVTP
jgi:iron complex transport system substrate-binding protein